MVDVGVFKMKNETDLEVQIDQDRFAVIHADNQQQGRVYIFTMLNQLAEPLPAHITFVRRAIIDGQQVDEQIAPTDPTGSIGFVFQPGET